MGVGNLRSRLFYPLWFCVWVGWEGGGNGWLVGGWWLVVGGDLLFRGLMGWDEAPGTSSLEAWPGNAGVPLISECYLLARRFVNW